MQANIILNKDETLYAHVLENGNSYVIPPVGQPAKFHGNNFLWIMNEEASAYKKINTGGGYFVKRKKSRLEITFEQPYETVAYSGCPNCDFFGNFFQISVGGSTEYEKTLALFYWKSILNQCAERSVMRRKKRLREGYVLSTLKIDFYGGTYPAVDHEFHIRGRLAMGGGFDLQVVRRMLALQLRMMRTDWRRQYRGLVSLQPGGRREYRVYRRSMDKRVKAVMFPLTAGLELVEEIYQYYCLTKDIDFVKMHINTIEKGLDYVLTYLDDNGRLWADVYYEDQVMKDGANAQAQAFAINSFSIMSKLESLLGNREKADAYQTFSNKMKANYIQPIPAGYWSEQDGRYIDWIDRQGNVHDHIHLLSNALPVTYGFHKDDRGSLIEKTIKGYDHIFQKFPSFVAAKIEDYTESEIGSGGPYDLCAAGRYWCHDAKYRRKCGDASTLKAQLDKVCRQAELDHFYMGERYDMNYVYYNTGEDGTRNWHGSPYYYEYPNVFADVLVHDFLGLQPSEKADISVAPCCNDKTHVALQSYGVEYSLDAGCFTLTNVSGKQQNIHIDLSLILHDYHCLTEASPNGIYSLAAGQSIVFQGISGNGSNYTRIE